MKVFVLVAKERWGTNQEILGVFQSSKNAKLYQRNLSRLVNSYQHQDIYGELSESDRDLAIRMEPYLYESKINAEICAQELV